MKGGGAPSANLLMIRLGGLAATLEGRAIIQQDLDRLECWTEKNPMKFNNSKHKVFTESQNGLDWKGRITRCLSTAMADLLERSSVEKGLGVLVDSSWS